MDIVDALVALSSSDSSIIVLLIITGIVIIMVGFPAYKARIESDESKLKHWIERESKIIQVIQQNSDSQKQVAEAISGLKTIFEHQQVQCSRCMSEQVDRFEDLGGMIRNLHLSVEKLAIRLGGEEHE